MDMEKSVMTVSKLMRRVSATNKKCLHQIHKSEIALIISNMNWILFTNYKML